MSEPMGEILAAVVPEEASEEARVLDSRPGHWAKLLTHPFTILLVVAMLFVAPITGALRTPARMPPKVMYQLPEFSFTNEKGQRFGTEELRGRIWVGSFVFTSCPVVCPRLMEKLQEVQHRTRNAGPGVGIVTFTVDPETDTPERLAKYARRFKASPYRWNFLTGDLKQIEATVIKGFKLAMGKQPVEDDTSLFDIFHSERFVLVDGKSRIRGYYEAKEAGIDRLLRDIGLVLNAAPGG